MDIKDEREDEIPKYDIDMISSALFSTTRKTCIDLYIV